MAASSSCTRLTSELAISSMVVRGGSSSLVSRPGNLAHHSPAISLIIGAHDAKAAVPDPA